jgi:DNA-binding transcriptional regulator LsrR (DeoR family)
MQVQRSISKSKKEGLVQIQIKDPCTRYFEIEDDLKTRFSLSEAIVTPTPQNKAETNEAIAKAAADYLLRHVSDNQIIGVGWGTTLQNMTRFVKGKTLTNSRIVSLIGGWTKMTKESPHKIAYNLADALKIPCYRSQ